MVHLRQKDIPWADRSCDHRQKLIGATVLLSIDDQGQIITTYRNRRTGLYRIKHKSDFSHPLRGPKLKLAKNRIDIPVSPTIISFLPLKLIVEPYLFNRPGHRRFMMVIHRCLPLRVRN